MNFPAIQRYLTGEWTLGKILSSLFVIYLIAVVVRVIWLEIR